MRRLTKIRWVLLAMLVVGALYLWQLRQAIMEHTTLPDALPPPWSAPLKQSTPTLSEGARSLTPPPAGSRYMLGDIGQACSGACSAASLSCSQFPQGGIKSEVANAMVGLGAPCSYFGGWRRGTFAPWVKGTQCYWDDNSDSDCDTPLAFTTLGVKVGDRSKPESTTPVPSGPRRLCWCVNRSSTLLYELT